MATPTHGIFCQSWTYPTKCWYCRAPIYIYQCSCGSVVLFDWLGSGWPIHVCGSVRRPPRPILSDTEWERRRFQEEMAAIQPGREQWVSVPAQEHKSARTRRIVTTLQDLPARTKRINSLDTEGPFELAAMKMRAGAGSYVQVTLRDTDTTPHQVYVAVVKRSDLPAGELRRNMRLGVSLEVRGLRRAEWFVVEIVALLEPGESPA